METTILSVGGSLIAPGGIDTAFLQRLKTTILGQKGRKFVLVCGGGATARNYQQAGRALGVTQEGLDWVGIYGTRLNAMLVKGVFGKKAHKEIVTNPEQTPQFREKILVAGGWKPGWSTDYVAVVLAKQLGAATVVNLSNTDYVYTADPKMDKDARPLRELSWAEFFSLLPKKWQPGMHAPFDPVASRLAAKLKLSVVCINGARLGDWLNGKDTGTQIRG